MRYLLAALILIGCGRYVVVPVPVDPIPTPSGKSVTLAVWGAFWCPSCKSMLPDIESELNKIPKADREKINFVLYVPTGMRSGERPTEAVAKAYASSLKLSAKAEIDPWHWQYFKKYVHNSPAIPAAALIDEHGKLIKTFAPGSFTAGEPVTEVSKLVR